MVKCPFSCSLGHCSGAVVRLSSTSLDVHRNALQRVGSYIAEVVLHVLKLCGNKKVARFWGVMVEAEGANG